MKYLFVVLLMLSVHSVCFSQEKMVQIVNPFAETGYMLIDEVLPSKPKPKYKSDFDRVVKLTAGKNGSAQFSVSPNTTYFIIIEVGNPSQFHELGQHELHTVLTENKGKPIFVKLLPRTYSRKVAYMTTKSVQEVRQEWNPATQSYEQHTITRDVPGETKYRTETFIARRYELVTTVNGKELPLNDMKNLEGDR